MSVAIVDDDVLEDVEQFSVEVVASGGQERVDVGDAANISIANDDCEKTSHLLLPFNHYSMSLSVSPTAVTVGLSSATYSVSEGGGIANVSLRLTGAAEREVSVLLQTGDGVATGSQGGWLGAGAGVMCCFPCSSQ